MNEFLYALAGIDGTGMVLFLAKWFGGKKGKTIVAVDTKRTSDALVRASELLGKRAEEIAKAEEDKKRIRDKLSIEDPLERLEAIADELKDL